MKLFAGSYSYSFSLLLNFCIFKGMFKPQNTPFVVESSLSNMHSHIIFYKFLQRVRAKMPYQKLYFSNDLLLCLSTHIMEPPVWMKAPPRPLLAE